MHNHRLVSSKKNHCSCGQTQSGRCPSSSYRYVETPPSGIRSMSNGLGLMPATCLGKHDRSSLGASGSRHPTECFGCGKRGHTFRNCPDKADPKTIENFKKKWEEMKQKRGQPQGADMLQASESQPVTFVTDPRV